ncbi:response regulator [Streptomyces sp. NPDC005167]
MITVLLGDDDPAARQGLRTIIDSSPDTRVVAEAWDGRSAVEQARRLLPDVVVMDVRMPGTDGIAATRKLRELPTPPAVLILTAFGLEEYVEQALKAGASGFLIKDTPPAELLSALRGLAEGHAVFAPEITGSVIVASVAPGSVFCTESFIDAVHALPSPRPAAHAALQVSPPTPGPSQLTVREAYFAKSRAVAAAETVGRLSASAVTACPPGGPIVLPGEVITAQTVAFLALVAASPSGRVLGAAAADAISLRVVDE